MANLQFRPATSADVPLLAALNQLLQIDEAHRLRMDLTELEPRMTAWLEHDGYEAHLFERNGEMVGYALYRREEGRIYLKQFFVGRQCRRQGIGRRVIEWLITNVWQDVPAVSLDVLVVNEPGIAFWRSVGFQDYCVTMERKLNRT